MKPIRLYANPNKVCTSNLVFPQMVKSLKVVGFFLSLVLLLAACSSSSSSEGVVPPTTYVSGMLSTSTIWGLADSPVAFEGDVEVASGVTLTIEPGVEVRGNGFDLKVSGTLSATGLWSGKVIFTDTHIVPGGTITNPFSMIIRFSEIRSGSLYQAGHSGYGSLVLEDSIIENLPYLYIWYPVADTSIRRNIFNSTGGISVGNDVGNVFIENNSFMGQVEESGILGAVQNWASMGGTSTFVRFNSFLSTDLIALELAAGYSTALMVADSNYFGTTDTATIDSMIFDMNDDSTSNGFITYTPILTGRHSNTPLHNP